MKKIIYLTLLSVFIASCNSNLDNKKVENFVVEHFKNQTIESEAISTLDVNISDSVILFNLSNGWVGRPNWVNDKSKIKTDWFYEDSVATEVSDVEIFGEIASVYGNVSFFTNGINTSNAGFHSLVGNENGKRDAQGPRAVERVEANPHDALAVVFASSHERRGRRVDERRQPRRGLDGERLGHLHIVEIDEAQQWVGTLPVHNQRSVDRAAGTEPVGRLCLNCQHVATWPSARHDVVEHDEIDRRRWVGEIRRNGQVELGNAAQRPLEKLVTLRNQQRAGVAPGQAQHRGSIIHGEYVVIF